MGYLSAFLSPFLVVFSTGDGFNNINRSLHAWRFCFLKLLTVVCYERRGGFGSEALYTRAAWSIATRGNGGAGYEGSGKKRDDCKVNTIFQFRNGIFFSTLSRPRTPSFGLLERKTYYFLCHFTSEY